MSGYVKLHRKMWDGDSFEQMNPNERYVALYLLTSPGSNTEGMFRFRMSLAAEQTGLDPTVLTQCLYRLHTLEWLVWDSKNGVICVLNALRYDSPGSETQIVGAVRKAESVRYSHSCRTAFAEQAKRYAPKLAAQLPSDFIRDSIDTVSTPSLDGPYEYEYEKELESEIEYEGEPKKRAVAKPALTDADFNRFWAAYINKQGKSQAHKRCKQLVKDGTATPDDLVAAAQHYSDYHRKAGTPVDKTQHGSTFVSPQSGKWQDWVNGWPIALPVDRRRPSAQDAQRESFQQMHDHLNTDPISEAFAALGNPEVIDI